MPNYSAFAPEPLSGLVVQVAGGTVFNNGSNQSFNNQQVSLGASTTSYVYFDHIAGTVGSSTNAFTSKQFPIAIVVTGQNAITSIQDSRPDLFGMPAQLSAPTISGTVAGPLTLSGAVALAAAARLKLADQGVATLSSGSATVAFGSTYGTAPQVFVTWNGTGTLTGILKAVAGTGNVTITSSVGTDTGQINWVALGN